MKNNFLKIVLILSIILIQIKLNAQSIFPPNYSFEADTILPWEVDGRYDLPTSVNMNFPSEGKYFIELTSSKIRYVYAYSTLKIKFPINERVRYLNFASMFWSTKDENKFRVKYQMTKFNPLYKRSYLVCNMDTMMDTICNIRDYREEWYNHKVDLKPYYLSNESPDTCYIEISCDFKHYSSSDFIQYLDLDNFVLTGNVDAQVSVQDQFKSKQEVLVYPNPASGTVNVDLSAVPDVVQLELLSVDGRSVMIHDVNTEITVLDVSSLSKGLYLLKITDSDHTQIFKEIVIE